MKYIGRPKLNIAHIVLSMEIGGLERLVEQILKKMTDSEFSPYLFCLDRKGVIGESLENAGYHVECFNRKHGLVDFQVLRMLINRIKKNGINVLHSHNQEALFYGVLAKLFVPGLKIIHTQHGDTPEKTFKKKIKRYILYKFINRYVGVSADVTTMARVLYRVPNNKLSLILNGVNTNYFSRAEGAHKIRDELNIKEGVIVLVCVARLVTVKNLGLLVDIVDELKESISDFKVLLVGDGPEREYIEGYISVKKLKDYIVLTGEKNNIKDYLDISDIFLLTSHSEGINVSLLEAMSMSLVPIVTDVGGNSEIISNANNGILVQDFDIKVFVQEILRLFENPDDLKKMGENAREKVVQSFSFSKMYDEYHTLYTSMYDS